MGKGEYTADDIVNGMVNCHISSLEDSHSSWLLDGYPRTQNQTHYLDLCLTRKISLDRVILVDPPQETIIGKLIDRWVHIPSGRIYNLKYLPLKVEGIDDLTGEPLSRRTDDYYRVILDRLKTYKESIQPILDFYSKKDSSYAFRMTLLI